MVKDDTSIKIKQELEESKKSEALLASLLENSSQPFGVGYPDGRLGLVNKAFEELTGYSREELKSKDWSEILTPHKFRDMENEKLEELQRTGQPVRYEKEYIKKDGTRVPIELLVHIVKNEDGTPEYYYSFITDITERKISEKLKQELLEKEQQLTEELTVSNEELQSTSEELQVTNEELMHQGDDLLKINKALEMSEERYRNILDNLQDAYIRADKEGIIIMASPSASHMYGYDSPQDMMGTKALSFYKNPEDRTYVLGELKKHGKMENNEVEALRKDGTSFFTSQNAQFYYDENGQVRGIETLVRDITEQKTAENEFKVSEKKYHSLYSSMNEGVALHEIIYNAHHEAVDYVITDINPAYETIVGLRPSEVVGKKASELYGTGSPPYMEIYANVAEKCQPTEFDTFFEPMNKYFRISVISPEKGKFATIFEDITERKKTEEHNQKLLENEQQLTEELQSSNEELQSTTEELYKSNEELRQYSEMLSTIYELNPDSIVLTTVSDSKIIDCNQEYLNQIGYSREEVIGRTSLELDLISSEERKAYIKETRGKEAISDYEGKVKRKDGSYIYVLYSTKLITVNNEPVVLNIGRNVTEKRRVEESLRESEERFRNLADNIPNLAWMADSKGWIFWYNKQWYEYTGTTLEEMQGWGWQKVHHPDYVDAVTEDWSTKLLKGEPYYNIFPLKGKDGNYRWFLTRVTPIRDEQGKIQRWFGTNTDITEQKIIEENLQNTMFELKQSNKELEQFAYITSHDLREPLRMITSFLQLLERRYKDQLDQDANEFIGFAVDGAKRLDAMTNDLLQYSKITNKKRELIPVNFENVLEHALTNLKVQIEENNAIITHDPLPTIKGDEQLKIQLFQNIIGNAIKYRSQETPKIHISATKEENQYLFSIKDNGIGMSHEHLERIFTIFQRLHTHEKYEGTGIGLAIAQKIVHQQGGQIWVESELGKGSTFYFTIPNKSY